MKPTIYIETTKACPKAIFFSIIVAALFVGLLGCGKSEATKAAEQQAAERYAARQKFKAAVASLKVCTGGSTYNEFRQAEMNLRTSFEVNKSYLDDILEAFNRLDAVISASEYCWKRGSYSMGLSEGGLNKPDFTRMQIINPNIINNSKIVQIQKDPQKSFTIYQIQDDPDFQTQHNVRLGLAKISELCEQMQDSLK